MRLDISGSEVRDEIFSCYPVCCFFVPSVPFSAAATRACTKFVKTKTYRLLGPDLKFYISNSPGTMGGYWRGSTKIYGRLDCPSAKRWIEKGHYVKYRVFFATESDAVTAGFRPCKRCMAAQ